MFQRENQKKKAEKKKKTTTTSDVSGACQLSRDNRRRLATPNITRRATIEILWSVGSSFNLRETCYNYYAWRDGVPRSAGDLVVRIVKPSLRASLFSHAGCALTRAERNGHVHEWLCRAQTCRMEILAICLDAGERLEIKHS